MEAHELAALTALWLGILTSISPCPLAANVAAISWIAKHLGRPRTALLAGGLYTAGRTLTYVALGAALVQGLLSVMGAAAFLQSSFTRLLGPLLIVVGLLLLGVLRFSLPRRGVGDALVSRVERAGVWGAGLMGVVFALSFCPVSAGLFFATLVPLAVERHSPVLLPTLFGLGTALPVAAVALLVALGVGWLGAAVGRLTTVERWARRVTAVVFILLGLYETLRSTLYLL